MALKAPEKVGDARPLAMVTPAQLELIKTVADGLKAVANDSMEISEVHAKIDELRALIPQLKTFVWGKGMIEQDFRFPDGTVKSFNLWHSPGGRPTIMLPVTTEGNIVWLRQWRPATNIYEPGVGFLYELPGGNPKKGEANPPHEKVAADELLEETGYRSWDWRRLHPTSVWFEPANLTPPYTPLIGLGCEFVQQAEPDDTELIEVVEISVWGSMELAWQGAVRDSKSLALLFLALPFLRQWVRINPA